MTRFYADERKIIILGATGLLGNAVFRVLSEYENLRVFGSVRTNADRKFFSSILSKHLILVRDLTDYNELKRLLEFVQPHIVVNCVATSRQVNVDFDILTAIYSTLPQQLAHLCQKSGIRLIHISSDGVFSGSRGSYREEDFADANDAYGVVKLSGEVYGSGSITLRTSIIGPELAGRAGILEWFLSQNDHCRGYTRAIFTGLPTVVLARLIRDIIIPRNDLSGIFHVASAPISKFNLLEMIAKRYDKTIKLIPDDSVIIDRSLLAAKFFAATGYLAPSWPEMIDTMYSYSYGLAKNDI